MEKANEQRAEQRLSYRWPVHFTRNNEEKALPGQLVDVSSRAMAFLCHAGENCPYPGQLLTTNFGVPHFNHSISFDTVLFNRTGQVHRLDELSSQVCRVVVLFTEPLFFNPGEQDLCDSDAQERIEAKTVSIIQAEEQAKVYDEALARAEERIRFYTETKVKAQAKAKSEAQARAKAEARAKSEAKLRAKAEKKAKTEAEQRARIEAEAQKKAAFYIEEIERIKAVNAQEITKIKEQLKSITDTNNKTVDKQPIKDIVLKKVDKFVTDRNKIF